MADDDHHPTSFAEDGPQTLGKLSIEMTRNTMATEGLVVKNTFLDIEVPRSPSDAPPPTNTAPGVLQRLIKARHAKPATDAKLESIKQCEEFESPFGLVPNADEPDPSCDRALSPPPPGLDILVPSSDCPERSPESSQTLTIPATPPGDFSQRVAEASSTLQPTASMGSALHSTGGCNPCAWYWKPNSCDKGYDCSRCHMCPDGELKRRKKSKAKEIVGTRKDGRKTSLTSVTSAKDGYPTQEPAYVVCGDTHKPVTFDTEFPNGMLHTKVTVGDVPVKNTFIDFKIQRYDDDEKKNDGPPTASAPGAMMSRLFRTNGPKFAPPKLSPADAIPDDPFGELANLQTPLDTPTRPPGVLLEMGTNEAREKPQAREGEEAPKAVDPNLTQREGHPMYTLHLTRECTPCNYFYYKADGCRQGTECQFCHLCPKGEIKKRKKERVKQLKMQSDGGTLSNTAPIAAH